MTGRRRGASGWSSGRKSAALLTRASMRGDHSRAWAKTERQPARVERLPRTTKEPGERVRQRARAGFSEWLKWRAMR